MTRSELLKLKPGEYLATDNICNYIYIIRRIDDKTLVCKINERGSMSFNSVSLHYDFIHNFDDDYDKWIPRKRMDTNMNIGGLYINKNGCYDILSNINLIGTYNRIKFKSDFNKFSLHHVINMNKYDRKRFKRKLL
jgi:hypothetical protein